LLGIASGQGLWQRRDRSVTAWLCCLHSELHKPQLQPWITHLSPQPPLLCLLWVLLSTGCRIHFYPFTFLLVTLSSALFDGQMNFCLEITIIASCRQGHKNWGGDSFQLFTPFHQLTPSPALSSMPLIFQLIHWSTHWSLPSPIILVFPRRWLVVGSSPSFSLGRQDDWDPTR
jgi:hypothetical protein